MEGCEGVWLPNEDSKACSSPLESGKLSGNESSRGHSVFVLKVLKHECLCDSPPLP